MTRDGAARGANAASIDSLVATGRGDDGTTGLLFGGPRISKDDPRTEAYGTVDEAVAALGLARAELGVGPRRNADPALAELGEVDPPAPARAVRRRRRAGHDARGLGPARGRADPRVGVDGRRADRPARGARATDHDAARVRRPRRDPDERRARAGPDDRPARRAARGRARPGRFAARTAPATVSQPSGRPGLGPGPGGRAGGGADQHPRPDRRPAPPRPAAATPGEPAPRSTTPTPKRGAQGAQTR